MSESSFARCTTSALLALALPAVAPAQDQSKPWYAMDYGPCLATTVRGLQQDNVALKGRVLDLGDGAWALFDTELLRLAIAWTDGHVALRGTPFDGGHGPIPHAVGVRAAVTRQLPGWANGADWDDPRDIPHGPLPREWGRFLGHYVHGDQVVLSYRVGERSVLESYAAIDGGDGKPVGISRTLEVGPGPRARAVLLEVPQSDPTKAEGGPGSPISVAWTETIEGGEDQPAEQRKRRSFVRLLEAPADVRISLADARVVLELPTADATQRVAVAYWEREDGPDAGRESIGEGDRAPDLSKLTAGGPRRNPRTLGTKGQLGASDGRAFAVDTITVPDDNPWKSRLRFGAFDFVDADTAALSTWNGDVWLVDGIDDDLDALIWSRFATGLHDPLGLKVVDGVIHTHGRDGIHRLHDLNGDGEADFYEVFNNDVLITKSFHEFAFDLQLDAAGNFYFSKGGPVRPGGRGFDKIVPHHGTIMRVSRDGSKLDVVATGLRAPNGIGVSPAGVVTSGDNQGTWMPACRLNVSTNGTFWGCTDLAHTAQTPSIYDDPICWLPMSVDNSGGGQVWVPDGVWGPLGGQLLHQSYGKSALYLVFRQQDAGKTQGGVVRIPTNFASSQMRGRFHASDGHLYVCGFKGWQTNAARPTAFQRVRRTSSPLNMPIGMKVFDSGIELAFSDPLDAETANDPESFEVEMWNYDWSQVYGSPEFSVLDADRKVGKGQKNRDPLPVKSARLMADGKTVFLMLDKLQRCMQMRVAYSLDAASDALVEGEIYNTVNFLPKRSPSRDD